MRGAAQAANRAQPDALVLDGATYTSLAIVRSLGAHGVRVDVAADTRLACAAASKYCRDVVRHAPFDQPEAVAQTLVDYARRTRGVVIMTYGERSLRFLYRWRQALEKEGARLAVPPEAAFSSANDKAETLRRAQRLGVPIPPSYFPESPDDVEAIAESIRYPAVVKPRRSVYDANDHFRATPRASYAQNAAELRVACSRVGFGVLPIVQEFVPGDGVAVSLLCEDGAPLMRFAHRRIRDVVPTGSGSALRESIAYPADLGAYAERLAADLAWTGPMMVEFRLDRHSGRSYLMEVNGRFWGSLQLAIDAGLDFPYAYYRMTCGQPVAVQSDYAVGIRSRWLVGDMLHVARVMRGRPAGFPGEYPTRRRTVFHLLRPSCVPTRQEVFRWSDPKPVLYELAKLAQRVFQRDSREAPSDGALQASHRVSSSSVPAADRDSGSPRTGRPRRGSLPEA
jgi:predicted ATP-grasp superfamily ATP-dependent carboligase